LLSGDREHHALAAGGVDPRARAHAADPLDVCRPLDIEVYTLDSGLLAGWRSPGVADYAGLHGMKLA